MTDSKQAPGRVWIAETGDPYAWVVRRYEPVRADKWMGPYVLETALEEAAAHRHGMELELERLRDIAGAVDKFIDRTHKESKRAGHNLMFAPEEYVGMLQAIVRWRRALSPPEPKTEEPMKFRKKPVVIGASQYTDHISYGNMGTRSPSRACGETGGEMSDLDCGDNNCYFAKEKTGMRTNGGCRCFTNAGLRNRSAVSAAIELLPKYLAATTVLQQERERVKDLETLLKDSAEVLDDYIETIERTGNTSLYYGRSVLNDIRKSITPPVQESKKEEKNE